MATSSKTAQSNQTTIDSTSNITGVEPYLDFQVDEVAKQLEGLPQPIYPEAIRAAGIEGRVLVQVVVDTSGRVVRGSLKILESGNALFETSVRSVIPRMRWSPAKVGGRTVPQVIKKSFSFTLNQSTKQKGE